MKKYISIVALLLCVVQNVIAQETGAASLRDVKSSLREALGGDVVDRRIRSVSFDDASCRPRSVSSLSGSFKETKGFGETVEQNENRIKKEKEQAALFLEQQKEFLDRITPSPELKASASQGRGVSTSPLSPSPLRQEILPETIFEFELEDGEEFEDGEGSEEEEIDEENESVK